MRYSTCSTCQALGALVRHRATRTARVDALIACFARLMRCAIVGSGTRNAFAISPVVRPPTARSVSAIADGVRQRRMAAHEQQHKRVVGIDRRLVVDARRDDQRRVVRRDALSRCAARSRCARDRSCAAARPEATSRAGCPERRRAATVAAAAISASCTASSHAAKSRWRRTTAPSTCGARSRSRCSSVARCSGRARQSCVDWRPLMISRTSMPMFESARRQPAPPMLPPRSRRRARALVTSTIQKPARNSFDSANTPSVIGLPSVPARTSFASAGATKAFGADQLAGCAELRRETDHERDVRFMSFLGHS